jgi:transporter family-2 protein
MKIVILFLVGTAAGCLITLQSVFNAGLGKRTGNLGSILLLTIVSIVFVSALILLFPKTASLGSLPGPSEWYLYLGGVLGLGILAALIFLVPQIGATTTLTALVVGQLLLALFIDHFGLFGAPRIEINLARLAGLALLIIGAYLIARK